MTQFWPIRPATEIYNVSEGLPGPDLHGEQGRLLFSKARLPSGGLLSSRTDADETMSSSRPGLTGPITLCSFLLSRSDFVAKSPALCYAGKNWQIEERKGVYILERRFRLNNS